MLPSFPEQREAGSPRFRPAPHVAKVMGRGDTVSEAASGPWERLASQEGPSLGGAGGPGLSQEVPAET